MRLSVNENGNAMKTHISSITSEFAPGVVFVALTVQQRLIF